MTYRTPENLIRNIMAKSQGVNLNEDTNAQAHMQPALKTPEEERLTAAVNILKNHGVPSAEAKDNAISISAADANKAADVLDRALAHGLITVRPQMTSAEAIPMPEPHVPAPEFAKEDAADDITDHSDKEDQTPAGRVEADGEIKLEPRTLRNRMENQMKKIDEDKSKEEVDHEINQLARDILNKKTTKEEIEQVDELSTETLHKVANAARKKNRPDVLKAAIKANQRKKSQPEYKFAGEETQLDELSLAKLVQYKDAAGKLRGTPLDAKIQKRAAGVKVAKKKIAAAVSKAMFGEDHTPGNMILRVRARTIVEARGERLKAVVHSECGNHHAKIYRDSEWNTHRVKFFVNGKHHEPADYETNDYHDAHGTANLELKRLSKYNGALKEATEEELIAMLEDEQLDELSRTAVANYVYFAGHKMAAAAADHALAKRDWEKAPQGSPQRVTAGRNMSDAAKQHKKRNKGIYTALDKLKNRARVPAAEVAKEEVAKEGNDPFLSEDLTRVGTYHDKGGSTLTMHRSDKDPEHHMLIHAGKVVASHHGTALDFHKKITSGPEGLKGDLHEGKKNHVPNFCKKCKEVLTPAQTKCPFCHNKSTPVDELHEQQIDELSRKTLANYVDAAKHSISAHAGWSGWHAHNDESSKAKKPSKAREHHDNQLTKRLIGVGRAVEKLAKEEKEQIDELSKDLLKRYMNRAEKDMDAHELQGNTYAKLGHDKAANVHYDKGYKRYKGIGRAGAKRNAEGMVNGARDSNPRAVSDRMYIDKEGNGHMARVLAREEEQIDEVSRELKRAYARKALDSTLHTKENRQQEYAQNGKTDKWRELNRKYHQRQKYIDKALEEEQLDEISDNKLKAYGRAAMKSVEDLHHKADRLSSASYTRGVVTDKASLGKSIETAAKAEVRKNYIRKAAARVNPGAARDNNNFNKYARHFHSSVNTKTLTKQYKRMAGIEEDVEQVNELSTGTLATYAIKAAKSKREHVTQTTRSLAKGNSYRSEPEVAKAHHRDAVEHARKSANRDTGIKRAMNRLSVSEQSLDEGAFKKKGRPRKERHETGEIVNDGKKALREGNADNKFKKNIFTVKKGMEAHPVLKDRESIDNYATVRSNDHESKREAKKHIVAGLKREGRSEIRNPTKHEGEYHAQYDSKRGVYDIKHRASGKTVEYNVANSGGAALARADHWNRKKS